MKTQLGHYEIVAELGRGGMGVVYQGFEPALGRYVAIKELSPALAHDPTLVERFLREARAMAALNDPHIIQIYFIGQDAGRPYFVMEFVEGESLSALLKREGRLAPADALKIAHQAAQGLASAHDQGVIHRDIKPGNLMLSRRGTVKLADFGIALANHDLSKKLTSTGEFVGTPGYLSPEVCLGKPVDQRSDIFALGIVLFEMLTGRAPFSDESPLKLMLEVVEAQIPDIRALNSEVDAEAAAILAKTLAKDPAERFHNCHQLADALARHPRVMQGGALKFNTPAPDPAAATVVGAATPGPTPRRAAGPLPVVSTPARGTTAANAEAGTAASARPSVLTRPERATPSRTPLLVAGLTLVLAASLAWGYRNALADWLGDATPDVGVAAGDAAMGASAGAVEGAANADAAATTRVESLREPSGDRSALDLPSLPEAGAAGAPEDRAGTDTSTPASADAAAANENATADAIAAAGADATPTLGSNPVTSSAPEPAPLASAPVTPRAARREAVREAIATRGVAVVTEGDPALTIPAQQQIEESLASAGLTIVEDPSGAGVVVRVRAEPIGAQEVAFYGQAAVVTTAYLSVRAFGGGRPLGPGFQQRVDYTALNAEAKAQQALSPQLAKLTAAVRGEGR